MTATDDVKQKADIVDVLTQYNVNLEKMGRNYKALCPFHSEKHASFFVFPDQQRWHCFGSCATGGDVIAFVMKKEGMDFGQALRLLADKTGVKLSKFSGEEEAGRDRLFRLNGAAAEFFHNTLKSTANGEKAISYLLKRGVSDSSISAFQLGYSPDSWDALKNKLHSAGYNEKDMASVGLVIQREGGGSYDRFRNRLMFPIRDSQGRITGFGGRALDDSVPKYMNSPQSPLFDKSGTLYGIDRASPAIKSQNKVVIVEGYMDVIVPHQFGFENVVASMGTALTDKQTSLLRRLTNRIALALDPDAAGTEATLRGIQIIDNSLARGHLGQQRNQREDTPDVELTIVVLPPGKDPDEVIKEDSAAWPRLVENATPAMDYILGVIASRVDLKQPQGRKAMIAQALPPIAGIEEPVKRSHYLQKLAQIVNLKEQDLWDTMGRLRTNARQNYREKTAASVPATYFSNPIEEYCLALVLQNPDLKAQCEDLKPDYFQDSAVREVASKCLSTPDIETLRSCLDPALTGILDHLLARSLPPANQVDRGHHLSDCILQLRERWLRALEAQKATLLQESEAGQTGSALEKLEQQGNTVSDQLHDVFYQPKGRQRLRAPKAP